MRIGFILQIYFLAISLILFSPLHAQSVSVQLNLGEQTTPAELHLTGHSFSDDRLELVFDLVAPTVLTDLDQTLRARGQLRGSYPKIKWRGPTRLLRAAPNGRLLLQGDVDIKYTSIFDGWDTKRVDFWVTPRWNPENRVLAVSVDVANVHSVPGSVENALRKIGVQSGRTIALADLADPKLDAADPSFAFGRAQYIESGGLTLTLHLSFRPSGIGALIGPSTGNNEISAIFQRLFPVR